jgi:hypothetical protein
MSDALSQLPEAVAAASVLLTVYFLEGGNTLKLGRVGGNRIARASNGSDTADSTPRVAPPQDSGPPMPERSEFAT